MPQTMVATARPDDMDAVVDGFKRSIEAKVLAAGTAYAKEVQSSAGSELEEQRGALSKKAAGRVHKVVDSVTERWQQVVVPDTQALFKKAEESVVGRGYQLAQETQLDEASLRRAAGRVTSIYKKLRKDWTWAHGAVANSSLAAWDAWTNSYDDLARTYTAIRDAANSTGSAVAAAKETGGRQRSMAVLASVQQDIAEVADHRAKEFGREVYGAASKTERAAQTVMADSAHIGALRDMVWKAELQAAKAKDLVGHRPAGDE